MTIQIQAAFLLPTMTVSTNLSHRHEVCLRVGGEV